MDDAMRAQFERTMASMRRLADANERAVAVGQRVIRAHLRLQRAIAGARAAQHAEVMRATYQRTFGGD